MSRFVILVIAVAVVIGGCSNSEPAPTTETSLEAPSATADTAEAGDVAVTTTTLPEVRYAPFVEAWNSVYETGSPAQIRRVLNAESLNLYGEEACVSYIQSQDPIPDSFTVASPAGTAQGLTQVELDGFRAAVYLDAPVVLEWPGGQLAPQWASGLVPDPVAGTHTQRTVVLADCGDPLEGRVPLVLAAYGIGQDDGADADVTISFDAPDTWWIEIDAARSGPPCEVAVVDAGSGQSVLSYTTYEDTAAELAIPGSLQIVASGSCPRIRAVSDESLLITPVTDLVANPASIWMPHIHPDGEIGVGDTIVIVNSGELPGDLTGWTLEGASFTLQFPDGFTIDPKQELFVHARCGTDTDTELHLCLEGNALTSSEMTLYDEAGSVIDGFS